MIGSVQGLDGSTRVRGNGRSEWVPILFTDRGKLWIEFIAKHGDDSTRTWSESVEDREDLSRLAAGSTKGECQLS